MINNYDLSNDFCSFYLKQDKLIKINVYCNAFTKFIKVAVSFHVFVCLLYSKCGWYMLEPIWYSLLSASTGLSGDVYLTALLKMKLLGWEMANEKEKGLN